MDKKFKNKKEEKQFIIHCLNAKNFRKVFNKKMIGELSKFNDVFDLTDEMVEFVKAGDRGELTGEQAPLFAKEWFIHLRALGILTNRMMVGCKAGYIKKYNAQSIFKIFESEILFKTAGYGWALCGLGYLIRKKFVKISEGKGGKPLYSVTAKGKNLAIEDNANLMIHPDMDFTEELKKFNK